MTSSEGASTFVNGTPVSTTDARIEQPSQASQTASYYINTQLRLENDAREVLPFSFDHCTKDLGPLRQNLFACLTCNPPPTSPSDTFTPGMLFLQHRLPWRARARRAVSSARLHLRLRYHSFPVYKSLHAQN